MPNQSLPRGFTLVELMIAMSLGVVICYTSFAGIRCCSQCVTQANRLSLENQLMRSGVLSAIEDIDFWKSYDDPFDPAKQGLRVGPVANDPYSVNQANPFRPYADAAVDFDFDHGDPKNWWRGPAMPLVPYGDYALFSRDGYTDLAGAPDPVKAKYPETMKKVAETLGYFALFEYFPANSMFQRYDANSVQDPEFAEPGLAPQNNTPNRKPRIIGNGWYGGWTACNVVSLTDCGGYCITARDTDDQPWVRMGANRSPFYDVFGDTNSGWSFTTWNMHNFLGNKWDMMQSAPEHWPTIVVDVRRMLYAGRQANLAMVILRHPLTGAEMKLHFTSLGSSLRGARQQRGLDVHVAN